MRSSRLLLGLTSLTLSTALVGCGQAGSSAGGAASSAAGAVSSAAGAASSAAGAAATAASGAASGAPGAAGPAAGQSGGGCRPATSQQLVLLQDDKGLQPVENVIPAINAKAATPPLVQALDKVQQALTQEKLVELNRRVQVDRQTPPNVAQRFVEENNLGAGLSGGSSSVVVGAANFPESEIPAHVYAQVLDRAGFDASVKKVGNRELYLPALQKGEEIQVMPEFVGTLADFLNAKQNGPDAESVASADLQKTVQSLRSLGEKVSLTFGSPAAADSKNGFAVNSAFAQQNGLQKLSDLSRCNGGQLVLGGPPECPRRPLCQPGLQRTYSVQFTDFKSLDAGGPLTKSAVQRGQVQVGLVFTSDPALGR